MPIKHKLNVSKSTHAQLFSEAVTSLSESITNVLLSNYVHLTNHFYYGVIFSGLFLPGLFIRRIIYFAKYIYTLCKINVSSPLYKWRRPSTSTLVIRHWLQP